MVHIMELSTELLECIISAILDPKDLFNLALVCKILHDLIIPHQLYFREIATKWDDYSDVALWNTINKRPILAHHIQTLQFMQPSSYDHVALRLAELRARVLEDPERTEVDSSPQGALETILQSISKMVHLRAFSWHSRITEESASRSCILGIFDGLDKCLNLTSLAVNIGYMEKHFMLPLPAQQLSFLTTLALAVPCLCELCASTSFYQKLLFALLETLQDVQIDFPSFSVHKEFPVSRQWNEFYKTVNWPNVRRLTLNHHGNNLGTSLHGSNSLLETFIARHPLMESFAYLGDTSYFNDDGGLDFSFALEHPSKLHNLKYVFSENNRRLNDKKLARVCDLQFVNTSFYNENVESLGSLPNLRFCSLTTRAQKFLARFVQLFPGVEKLNITLVKKNPGISEISNYIANLEGLNKLTHLGGLLCSHTYDENNRFLKIAAETVPSLTHVQVYHSHHKVWALVGRNAEGEYTGYEVVKLNNDGPPDWGLFFFGIPYTSGKGFAGGGYSWYGL
ncbi:hypothetical protein M422DRAFT_267816 [Sphaerobolus stellatus SS14]|uniref:F-box domain-containing protein n=1 Tax=Sphaerobolus stellatus (strain SS14) TaxID=990650 RepID=A0A0C9UZK9_SPHS4|nr:hypothetical protein M422DRAFT_267816 [Sphaerobolus stellatus SS14]